MNAGRVIIDAVIRADALQSASHPTDDVTIFAWRANAEEQIESALKEAGFELVKIQPQTEL